MAKQPKKPKKPNQVWKLYEAKDKLTRKNVFCPKCGAGYFMAKHKERTSCGKCGYTEMSKKQ
ncbi:30S ribosomal protein S27ae [Candidatus Woesearchaeota archaeon]|mgnify:CR=1 FL=1|nr:30S ribosomal protein S27ae [Candidatus Woesearchaeota archaeon]|tara:strand:+ start:6009 stop:6194 length:186 start_codon:yes stop_codon:yes gene_type:complete